MDPRIEPRREDGFTLVELMTVVLIVAILMGIALASYMAARTRAMDRAAQSAARQGLTSEITFYADSELFTDDPVTLATDTPLYTYVAAASQDPREISLFVPDLPVAQRVILGVRSESGSCYYLDHDMGAAQTRYGRADGVPCDPDGSPVGVWTSAW